MAAGAGVDQHSPSGAVVAMIWLPSSELLL
jgi:hypothetical protein